jgi:predicted metal-dependent hydrolase
MSTNGLNNEEALEENMGAGRGCLFLCCSSKQTTVPAEGPRAGRAIFAICNRPFGILLVMPLPIDHLIHSRRKTVALIIQRDGSLTVRAPLRMSEIHIQEFVQNHADWIRKKQAQAKTSPLPLKKHYIDGETFLYLGKEFPLTIVAPHRPALTFSGNKFHLANSSLPKARQVFIRWYKAQALMVVSERVAFHANQNQFTWRKIRISSARTRWGSCSANGTLSFTWRLVLAPPEVIDYVIVHELVHTQIRDHSQKFWRRVAEIIPEYKRHVSWLKKNGRFLTLGDD